MLVVLCALYIRFNVVEQQTVAEACMAQVDHMDTLCRSRAFLVWATFGTEALGWVALAIMLLAWALQSRTAALLGVLIGLAGLVLFCYELAAVGFVGSLLALSTILHKRR